MHGVHYWATWGVSLLRPMQFHEGEGACAQLLPLQTLSTCKSCSTSCNALLARRMACTSLMRPYRYTPATHSCRPCPGTSARARARACTRACARRSLGQNFVTDDSVLRDIAAAAAVEPGDLVLEVRSLAASAPIYPPSYLCAHTAYLLFRVAAAPAGAVGCLPGLARRAWDGCELYQG